MPIYDCHCTQNVQFSMYSKTGEILIHLTFAPINNMFHYFSTKINPLFKKKYNV